MLIKVPVPRYQLPGTGTLHTIAAEIMFIEFDGKGKSTSQGKNIRYS